jgi:putative ABC transport system permease protein
MGEGVDPDREGIVSRVLHVVRGEPLAAGDRAGVLLGVGLAEHLDVKPGDSIVLLSTSAAGSLNAVDAHVRGLMRSELKSYDDNVMRVPIELAQQLVRTRGSHVWVVALRDTALTQAWVTRMRGELSHSALELVPWFDMADFYKKTVTLLSSQLVVVRMIIATIIVLGISNVLVMSVLERTGEIGTLLAVGTPRIKIMEQFLWEGLLLGLFGGLLGTVFGVLLAYAISAIGIPMPPPPGREAGYSAGIMLTWRMAAEAFALAVVTSLAAAVFPAWKASRLVIVDALRHNR